jgi:hypothetical protein
MRPRHDFTVADLLTFEGLLDSFTNSAIPNDCSPEQRSGMRACFTSGIYVAIHLVRHLSRNSTGEDAALILEKIEADANSFLCTEKRKRPHG